MVRGEPAVAWRADRIIAAGVELARFTTGSSEPGAPGLLLLHGLGHWTSAAWDRLVPALDPAWRIVSIDLPGFGESARPDVAYDLPFFRAVVDDVARLSLPATFAIAGNSLGGMIAADYAATYPDRVTGLALLAPAGFMRVPALVVRAFDTPLARAIFGLQPSRGFVRRTLLRSVVDVRNVPEAQVERAYGYAREPAYRRSFARVYGGALQEMRDVPALRRRFARFAGPVYLAWGRHDVYIPLRALSAARATDPQASADLLEHAGHVGMVEMPEAVAAGINALRPSP